MLSDGDNQISRLSSTNKAVDVCMRLESQEKQCSTKVYAYSPKTKITQKGIPEGMTLGQAFIRTIELEAGYQLSEGVSLARPPRDNASARN